MERQPTASAWHPKFSPFGKLDWILNRGMFGFGTCAALLFLLLKIYQGKPLTFGEAAVTAAIWVFLCGPAWGYFMWRYATKQSRRKQREGAALPIDEATPRP